MRYFEDFQAGEVIDLGSWSVTEEEIIDFARRFDPQVFHIDPARAKESLFGGLVASGWHTSALCMRRLVDGLYSETASMGSPGLEELRWPNPVRPGDVINVRLTVLECRPSRSRPTIGIMRASVEAFNQAEEPVMIWVGTTFIQRRPEGQE